MRLVKLIKIYYSKLNFIISIQAFTKDSSNDKKKFHDENNYKLTHLFTSIFKHGFVGWPG